MKILYTITKSTIGGAQTHISQLTSSLLNKGHEIGVVSQPSGWLEDDIRSKNDNFYPNKHLKNTYNPLELNKAIQTTKKALKDFKPDIFSCHSSFAGLVGRIAAKNLDIPTIFTAHGWGFSKGTPFFRKNIVKTSEKYAAQYTDKIICVSDYDKQLAIEDNIADKDKLITIHNGTEIPNIKYDQFPIKDKVKIVYVGRFSKQKAPLLLLKALNNLSKELKNKIEVTLIGNGPKEPQIRKYMENNNLENKVKLTGDMPREQVFKHLQESHIFTLITNWEGFPRSILEAMSCGLPIVATKVAGVPESVTNDCGILVEKDSKEDITKAFTKLISNPKLIEKKGKNARKRVKEKFSIEKTYQKTKKVYKNLLEK